MRFKKVKPEDLIVGQEIDVSFGSRGQGGTFQSLSADGILAIQGPDGTIHNFSMVDVQAVGRYVFLDAEECSEFGRDCRGVVDYCYTPSGSSLPRCEFHNRKRWDVYENDKNSVARYANSDVEPEWFDPAYAGENWD